ncbi:endonuclease [Bacteriophage sp.]|nr:endonuclease [Bacteriophage sp.]UOF80091.1 endonuclease [Bacteriophage sp.]
MNSVRPEDLVFPIDHLEPRLPTPWRLDALVHPDPDTGCWVWQGRRRTKNGYGRILVDGREVAAHRFFYQAFISSVGSRTMLDHLCLNRLCCNPWHLEPVTARENTRRGTSPTAINGQKLTCKRGHSLVAANLVPRTDGRRECRLCRTLRGRKPGPP